MKTIRTKAIGNLESAVKTLVMGDVAQIILQPELLVLPLKTPIQPVH